MSAFDSLVITIDVNGIRLSASLGNGMLSKSWNDDDPAEWRTNG